MPLFHEIGNTQENNMNDKHEMFLFSCTQRHNDLYYMHFFLPHLDVNLKCFHLTPTQTFVHGGGTFNSSILKTDMPYVECRLGFIT